MVVCVCAALLYQPARESSERAKKKSSEKFCGNFAPTSCELQLQLRVTATRMSYLISLVCGLSMAFRPAELLLPWLTTLAGTNAAYIKGKAMVKVYLVGKRIYNLDGDFYLPIGIYHSPLESNEKGKEQKKETFLKRRPCANALSCISIVDCPHFDSLRG